MDQESLERGNRLVDYPVFRAGKDCRYLHDPLPS